MGQCSTIYTYTTAVRTPWHVLVSVQEQILSMHEGLNTVSGACFSQIYSPDRCISYTIWTEAPSSHALIGR